MLSKDMWTKGKKLPMSCRLVILFAVLLCLSAWVHSFSMAYSAGRILAIQAPAPWSMRAHDPVHDYIIVGGGTAGCVLADRLTSEGRHRVLALEGGSRAFESKNIRVPAGIIRLFRSVIDWQHESVGEKYGDNRTIYMARGKVLGGSSALNAMLYQRGASSDYDNWGVNGWSSQDVLTYFKAAEHNDDFPEGQMFLRACQEIGLPSQTDFNDWSRSQRGMGASQVFQRFGRRESAATAYLKKAMRRKNLQVSTDSLVTRILFEGTRAVGVEYTDAQGTKTSARAADGGEVLLCAGAIKSPQLLMLSGLGPATHLQQHGVPVIRDMPEVGLNLQDHPAVTIMNDISKPISITNDLFRTGTSNLKLGPRLNWALSGRGPLTSPGCDIGGFLSSHGSQSATNSEADLQLRFVAGRAETPDGVQAYRLIGNSGQFDSGVTVQIICCRPKSRGHVRLASTDPAAHPEITLNYLKRPEDLATLTAGIKLSRQILRQRAFSDVMAAEKFPGADKDDDVDLASYVRRTVHSANALVGTCRMGADEHSVVDEQLQVRGVKGLRVIDASIIPNIPGAQTGAVTYMIAEKGAALVLQARSSS